MRSAPFRTSLLPMVFLVWTSGAMAQDADKVTVAPNPFSDSTVFTLHDLQDDTASIFLYNSWGDFVATLIEDEVLSGTVDIPFHGEFLESGIYIYIVFLNNSHHYGKLAKLSTTTLADVESGSSVMVYPNPATDVLYLQGGDDIRRYVLTDMQGHQVAGGELMHATIPTSGLSGGMYVLHLYDALDRRVSLRIAIMR